MINKIKRWLHRKLIVLANKLNDSYYDFGDEIVALNQFKGYLIVATKKSVFASKDAGKTWVKTLD